MFVPSGISIGTTISAVEMARGFLAGYYGLRVLNKNISDKSVLNDAVTGLLANL